MISPLCEPDESYEMSHPSLQLSFFLGYCLKHSLLDIIINLLIDRLDLSQDLSKLLTSKNVTNMTLTTPFSYTSNGCSCTLFLGRAQNSLSYHHWRLHDATQDQSGHAPLCTDSSTNSPSFDNPLVFLYSKIFGDNLPSALLFDFRLTGVNRQLSHITSYTRLM